MNILLLHGALGSSQDFVPLADELRSRGIRVSSPDFPGHGKRLKSGQLTIPALAEYTRASLTGKPVVFGYSMGGYVALYLESKFPGTFTRITTLATKMDWSKEVVTQETSKLQPQLISEKSPAFAQQLQVTHGNGWHSLVTSTKELIDDIYLHQYLDPSALKQIGCPVTMCVGSNDKMVSVNETEKAVSLLSDGTFRCIEGWKHPLATADIKTLAGLICEKL